MSSTKGKGGTGRGTDKKGWNRWQASAKKKAAPKIFGKNQAAKGAEGEKNSSGNKPAAVAKGGSAAKGSIIARGRNTVK